MKKSPAVRIESAIMEQLHKTFPNFSDCEIIQSAVIYTLLFCCKSDTKRGIKKVHIERKAQGIKSSSTNISYRISDKILDKLELFYADKNGTLTKTQIIKYCLSEVLYLLETTDNLQLKSLMCQINSKKKLIYLLTKLDQAKYTKRELTQNENIAYRSGIKSDKTLNSLLETIEEIKSTYSIRDYIEPFMGTGNVLCHISPFSNETLNDLSEELVHILTILKKYPVEFIMKLMSLDVDKKTFSEQQKLQQDIKNKYKRKKKEKLKKIRNKNECIDKAVADYYILLLSVRGDCTCFDKNATNKTLLKKATILQQIGQRLRYTNISCKNAFDLLRELEKSTDEKLKHTLCYLDPPYILSEKYYKVCSQNGGFSHEELQELLTILKNKGTIIVLSYRASLGESKKNPEVQKKLDKLYMNQGFFLKFIPSKNDQIELLLSSVKVSESVPFDCNIATLIEKQQDKNNTSAK